MHFGEYELSPSLIGLSLLHSAHPEAFQRLSVRTSIRCYPDFILAQCRSLGFASASADLCALFRLAFTAARGVYTLNLAGDGNSQVHYAKGTPSLLNAAPTACRRTVSGTISLFCPKCFSPFPHGTGSLSVSREYLALPDGPGGFAQGFSCPALLRVPLRFIRLRAGGFHPLRRDFPDAHARLTSLDIAALQHRICASTHAVWALPRSLATTGGIIILFSLPAGTKMFQFPAFAPAHKRR